MIGDPKTWKAALQDQMESNLAKEIDTFEGQIELKRQGKLEDRVFAETRLRRGVYGQRYDNAQRHDGNDIQQLNFPSVEQDLTKGPDTAWDAPGMMRIKIPFGGMSAAQLEAIADVAEEYADDILHVTTRQDIQLHYIHLDDTPDLMRRLAAAGITTREACGNTVRNVTACPIAGVCHDETFDVTPYSKAVAYYLLGHPDCQDFGRKVKVAFSGCRDHACALTSMHDLGFIAKVQDVEGQPKRGFEMYVGGGLGAVPHQAKLLSDFVPEEEIMPLSLCVARVFARLGEKKNRNRARIKFLVQKLGIEEFRRLVEEERKVLPHDDYWTEYLKEIDTYHEQPLKDAVQLNGTPKPEGFDDWAETNVMNQRQTGYATVTVNCPLGDITADQARGLADLCREFVGDHLRTTVEQNFVLRWVSEQDLPKLYEGLISLGLGDPGAGTIVDLTACPGTDTCKLGIASSRGLAGELRTRLTAKSANMPQAIKDLKIKISGCFNSCGQHHVADIGFYGNSRKIGGYTVPHFQVVLGGQWSENAASYGLACGSVPSKAIPDVLDVLSEAYLAEREEGESFKAWTKRKGKKAMRGLLQPYMDVPSYGEDKSFYTDWGDPREFTIGDMGTGECAGEVVSLFSIEMSKAEGLVFDAQVALEEENAPEKADKLAYEGMLRAARALVLTEFADVGTDPQRIVDEFKTRFFDTQKFYDRYAKGKFGQYLFERHQNPPTAPDADRAHRQIEEAQLFLEATHACEQRLSGATAGGVAR